MEAHHVGMAAAAGAVENGQVHQNDDGSSIEQLRAQLQEQVLSVFSCIKDLLLIAGLYALGRL